MASNLEHLFRIFPCICLIHSHYGLNPTLQVHKNWQTDEQIINKYPSLNHNGLQQVRACIVIGLKCVEADRNKRPSIVDIVQKLNGKHVPIFDQVWTIQTSSDQWSFFRSSNFIMLSYVFKKCFPSFLLQGWKRNKKKTSLVTLSISREAC